MYDKAPQVPVSRVNSFQDYIHIYIHKHNAHNVHVTNRKKNMKWNPSQRTHTHTHTTNSLIGRYMMYHIISPFDAEHFCILIVLHHIQYRTTVD